MPTRVRVWATAKDGLGRVMRVVSAGVAALCAAAGGDCCQRLVTRRVREMLRVCQPAPSRLWQPPGSRAMLRPVSVRPRSLCTRLMHPDRALLALFIHKPLIPVRFVELAQSVQMQWSPFDARSPVA